MCDTLVVVWPEGLGFAKNSDRDPNEAQRLDWIPAGQHPPGSALRCTWRTIPQVERTRALLLSRPFWTWGAEMGTNETGLVVGNEAVFTRCKMVEPGLTGMDLVRLALERSDSVDQAIGVLSDLIQNYGQGGRAGYSHPDFRYHNSFLIADPLGAAVLEAAGNDIAVERVTHGARAISNGLTIASLQPLADRLRGRVAECRSRRGLMELSGNMARQSMDLAAALRDHGTNSPEEHWPRFRRLNGALSAPCVHFGGIIAGSQTVGSWISMLSPKGIHHWATGTSATCISLFRPISIDNPRDVGSPEGFPDNTSLWWRFETLHRRLMLDWSAAKEMCAERDEIERRAFANPEDQDVHWKTSDAWLKKWECEFQRLVDRRPGWLRRCWEKVHAEAAQGNRLPPRNALGHSHPVPLS